VLTLREIVYRRNTAHSRNRAHVIALSVIMSSAMITHFPSRQKSYSSTSALLTHLRYIVWFTTEGVKIIADIISQKSTLSSSAFSNSPIYGESEARPVCE
jgi:hypothetical protein